MIIDCAVYDEGQRRSGKLQLEEAGEACKGPEAFVWLGVVDPAADEFETIAQEFDLHELAVEDAIEAHQRPKVERYGETLLVVVKSANYKDHEEIIEIGELVLFVNPAFVITVRHGAGPLKEVRERLERSPELLAYGPTAVLYAVLDRIVDDYELAAHDFDIDIQEVEKEVFSADRRNNPAERIYKLEREMLDFSRAVLPLSPAVGELARGHFDIVPGDLHEYFRDVHDHLQRVSGQINGFRELLSSALHANLTQVSVRQNEDMRKISAWVAILAVPTGVAAVYGMNFKHMPELDFEFGYPIVLCVIAAICLFLFRRFKRAGWL